jgi:hypothetical protein
MQQPIETDNLEFSGFKNCMVHHRVFLDSPFKLFSPNIYFCWNYYLAHERSEKEAIE